MKRSVVLTGLALAPGCSGAANAAEAKYSSRPVRLLIPFAPGGSADTLARILAPKLFDLLGQPWVVDNRGGAADNLAAEIVARAAPDGYTLFEGFNTVLTVNPTLYKLPFDMARDLQPVALLATAQYILVFGSVAASLAQAKAGKLRALATTGAKRSKVAPELPTIAKSGFPSFDVDSWYAFLVPKGTPATIVKQVHDATVKAIAMPDVQQAMSRQGLEPGTSTPAELAKRISRETQQWAAVIREQGIKAE